MEALKVMRQAVVFAAICAVAGLAAPPSRAACGDPLSMSNLSGYPIVNCPDGKPASGYSYQPGAASPTNTGNVDIICEADLGVAPCNTMPGTNSSSDDIVAISTDLPYTIKNWCAAAGVDKVMVVSDHFDANFGEKYGTLVKERRILRRAVFVVDKEGKVVYSAYMPVLGEQPDYGEVLAAARNALKNR